MWVFLMVVRFHRLAFLQLKNEAVDLTMFFNAKKTPYLFAVSFLLILLLVLTVAIDRKVRYVKLVHFLQPSIEVGPYIFDLPEGYARLYYLSMKLDNIDIVNTKLGTIGIKHHPGCQPGDLSAKAHLVFTVEDQDSFEFGNSSILQLIIKEANGDHTRLLIYDQYCITLIETYMNTNNINENDIRLILEALTGSIIINPTHLKDKPQPSN